MDTRRVVRGFDEKEKPTRKSAPKKSKSPSRKSGSPPPARMTRARSKSPARVSRPRSKSPARVSRKASPSRAAKTDPEVPTKTSARLRAKGKASYSEVDDSSESKSSTPTPKPTSPMIKLSKIEVNQDNLKIFHKVSPKKGTATDDSGTDKEVAQVLNNRRTRLARLMERFTPTPSKDSPVIVDTPTPSEGNTSKSRSTSVLKEKEFSDSEESELPSRKTPVSQPSDILDECGGNIGSVVHLILVTVLPLALFYHCRNGGNWSFKNLWEDLKNPYTYCNNQSGSILTAFTKSTWLLSLLPIGRYVTVQTDNGPETFKFNGLVTAFVIVLALFGFEYYELDIFSAIYDNIDRLLYMNVLNALLLSLICFLHTKYSKSADRNPYGSTNKFLVDFFSGTEINPKFFKYFNVKAIVYHQAVIFTLMFNICFLYKNISFPTKPSDIDFDEEAEILAVPWTEAVKQTFESFLFYLQNAEFNKLALVVSSLLSLYSLDSLFYEHHLSNSFELNQQGTGASLLLRHATFPFCLALLPKFLLEQQLDVSCWLSCGVAVLFLTGLVIKRFSTCLKYNYRLNPYDQKYKG